MQSARAESCAQQPCSASFETAMGDLLGRLGPREAGLQVVAHLQPTAPIQVRCEAACEFLPPALAQDGVPITRLTEFKLDKTTQHLLAILVTRRMSVAARGGGDHDDDKETEEPTHSSLHLKKWTRIGGDCAAMGRPVLSCAGWKRVLRAQRRAAAPNPNPGSERTSTLSARPSARTAARSTTVCSFTCCASASAGQGQFQAACSSETGRARLPTAGDGLRGVPGITAPNTGLRLVPALLLTPPAYEVPEPTMKAEPVKSTGNAETAASCPACAGGVGRSRGTWVARVT